MRYNYIMQPSSTMRSAFNRSALLALAFAAALLAACSSGGPDAAFDEYLSRLARTLDVEPAQVSPVALTQRPAPRDLRLTIRSDNLDALDFLALTGCGVQVTIGKRNSSLGRMASPSQRLLLDLEYLRLAPECIDYQRSRGETALADDLQAAWEAKREQLPASIFNATLGGSEYRNFWKPPPRSAANYPANTGSGLITVLEELNAHVRRWLAGDYVADNTEFEILLGEIAQGDGGALQRALAQQDSVLETANILLAERTARGPLCSANIRPAAADILPNVIQKFFILGIQPRAALLNRRYHELLPPVLTLEQLLMADLPPAYQDWREQRDTQLTIWVEAPLRHVEALKAVLEPCESSGTEGE